MQVVVFDIDGTLSDCRHRLKYISERPKDWKMFFEAQVNDSVNEPVAALYRAMRDAGHRIFVVTARPNEYRKVTEEWLKRHDLGGYERLVMREEGDRRNDQYVKKDVLDQLREEGIEVFMAIEDRARVCAMWRESGVTCLQVAEGNF